MDKQFIRLHSEFLALENLMIGVMRALQRSSPAFAKSLAEVTSQKAEEYRWMRFPDLPPEMADALAGDFSDAWERLVKRVLVNPSG
jgi:hypothetical protein